MGTNKNNFLSELNKFLTLRKFLVERLLIKQLELNLIIEKNSMAMVHKLEILLNLSHTDMLIKLLHQDRSQIL